MKFAKYALIRMRQWVDAEGMRARVDSMPRVVRAGHRLYQRGELAKPPAPTHLVERCVAEVLPAG